MTDQYKLLPCPFCGNDAHVNTRSGDYAGYYVSCDTDDCCGCPSDDGFSFIKRKDAVAAWNTRASIVNAPVGEVDKKQHIENYQLAVKCALHSFLAKNKYATIKDAQKAIVDFLGSYLEIVNIGDLLRTGHLKDASGLVSAAKRYQRAVHRLGENSGYNHMSYFEAPILKMPSEDMKAEAFSRWNELNDSGKELTEALNKYQESGE